MTRWRPLAIRLAPAMLVLALGVAWLLPSIAGVSLASEDEAAAAAVGRTLDALPEEPNLFIGFDPDLGTYAEIRPTVRALLADLLNRDARLVFVSLTPEGRTLLAAELARLARGEADPTRFLDLGFLPGAEAALVRLARELPAGEGEDGALARRVAADGIGTFDALVVVGGIDIGPRSWIEQLVPRIEPLPLVAVTPTVLLPEVQPFLATGQIDALLGTPRDGAAYRERAELGPLDRLAESGPRALPILVGLVVAVAILGQGFVGRLLVTGRQAGPRAASEQ